MGFLRPKRQSGLPPADDSAVPAASGDNEIVCYCVQVRQRALRVAIANGASTVDQLRDATGACTGCQTCRWDLEDLLKRAGHPADG